MSLSSVSSFSSLSSITPLDLEFDFWPEEKLATLIACLNSDPTMDDPRMSLPSKDDTEFWMRTAETCGVIASADTDDDSHAEAAKELATAVHSEVAIRDITCIRAGLYLGDLSGPESRLTMLLLGVRGVLTVRFGQLGPAAPNS
jgi:hypothetical protein